jgi:hypothetical protein
MANTTVRIKRSGASGNIPSSLTYGELALNYADGKLFYKASNGSILQFSAAGGGSDSFATINANSSLILASSPTDTLNIVPGNNITISACTSSKTITINSTGGGNKSTSSSTPPVAPGIGDFWYDTLTDVLYRYTTDGVSDFWFDLSGQSVGGGSSLSGNVATNMYITGNVSPTTDNVYNLGSSTNRWHSLYVGPGSIDLGGVVLSNVNGNLVVSGNSDIIVSNVSISSFTQTTTENTIYQSGVDATQNTNIIAINTKAQAAFDAANASGSSAFSQAAFDKANTASSNTIYQSGVNSTQNTNITSVDTKAQAAFDKANTGFSTSGGTISGDTIITGNLTVNGTQFYANTVNLVVEDNIITLNSNVTGTPSLSAGIEVNRGSSTNTKLLWSEANSAWEFTNNGTTYDKLVSQAYANAAYASSNTNATNITILQGVDATQNTNITAINTKAQAAFDKANTGISSISIVDEATSSATYYPLLSVSSSGSLTSPNTSSSKLSFVPSTGTLTTVDLNTTSDIKFKEDVQPITGANQILNKLDGVSFTWKETGKKSYGMIAQELQKVLPELVSQENNGLSVSYLPLIAILIEAVKEQQKQIDELKNQ